MHVDATTTTTVDDGSSLSGKTSVEPKSGSSTHVSVHANERTGTVRESSQVRIGDIMTRLQGLDREKQKYILQVLEQLEVTKDDETRLSILESVQWLPSEDVDQSGDSCAMQPMAQISFHLISNWGHEKTIGLTAVRFPPIHHLTNIQIPYH
jgi:hypothetical protein